MNYSVKYLISILIVLFQFVYSNFSCQFLPNLSGQDLRNELVKLYKTNTVLSYEKARDTLFAKIYNHNDSITCVYTGYIVYIDPSQDPSTYAYNNYNFQTEHTWPQSMGAEGQAKSDMHHLYPVVGGANASRGNEPFKDFYNLSVLISKWWYLNTSFTNISQVPSSILNLCSKRGNSGGFEPRDDHKGNVVRAMYYFYTMYKTQADSADSTFFNEEQKEVLYQWHYKDPPDATEKSRNTLIANYQNNKKNPFIEDLTLLRRAYPIIVYKTITGDRYHRSNCQYLSSSKISITLYNAYKQHLERCSVCIPPAFPNYDIETNVVDYEYPYDFILSQNYPNPFNSITTIKFTLPKPCRVKIIVYDVIGREISNLVNEEKYPGFYEIKYDAHNLSSGVYFYTMQTDNFISAKKFVLLK